MGIIAEKQATHKTPTPAGNSRREIYCGISQHFINKENRAPERLNRHTGKMSNQWAFADFPAKSLSDADFTGHILSGRAWIPSTFKGGHRTNENWQQAQLIAVDYDNNVSVADALAVPFIRQYAMLVHPSASSSADKYKTRVIFRLDNPITGDFENYRTAARAICRALGLDDDPVSYKPAQLYYGSTNRIEQPHVNLDAVLPLALVDDLAAELRAAIAQQEAQRAAEYERMQFVSIDIADDRAGARVQRALEDAFNKVAGAAYDRTGAVYGQAFRLGRLLAYWPVAEQTIIHTLTSASHANGAAHKYGDDEILRHIHNGIRDGMAEPEPLAIPTRDKHGRPLPTDDIERKYADTVQDATAAWDALPSVGQGHTSSNQLDEVQTAPEGITNCESHKLSQGVILGLTAYGPKNAAGIAKGIDDAGRAEDWLTIPEIAALPTIEALGLTTDQLYAFAEKPTVCQLFGIFSIEASDPQAELMGNFYSIDTNTMEKKPTNLGGRPAGTYYRLKSNAELADIIRREARQAIPALTAQYDGKALPLEWTPEQIAELPGAIADPTTAEAIQQATAAAKAADDDFADDLRLHGKRAAELWAYLERELDNEDPASLYPIDPDLLGQGSAHNIMAAAAHRYYHDREPNRTGDTWLFAALCGVSRPTLKKVREIARLKYAADTHETIELKPDSPDAIAREINRIARNRGGRALYISTPGYKPVPVRRENLPGVIACAARNDTTLRIELSVSQPLERYTPTAEQLAAEQVQRETKPARNIVSIEDEAERKPRQPKQERRDVYLQSFRRIPAALGWTFDGNAWMHPDASGELYPDHVPTLLKAITGLDVPGAGGPLSLIAVISDKPEESLPVAPPPELSRQRDIWADSGYFIGILREPGLFDRRGA